MFVDGDADVLVDVVGMFIPVPWWDFAREGRLVPLSPTRALDTRTAAQVFIPAMPERLLDTRADNATKCSHLFDPTASDNYKLFAGADGLEPTIPACIAFFEEIEMVAVVANWTITGASAPGFVTGHPLVDHVPGTSTVNVSHPDDSVAAFAVVPHFLMSPATSWPAITTRRRWRWANDQYTSDLRLDRGREAQVAALDHAGDLRDGHECLAEAVAAHVFATRELGPYDDEVSYDGAYADCARTPETQVLAAMLLTTSE